MKCFKPGTAGKVKMCGKAPILFIRSSSKERAFPLGEPQI